MREGRSLRVRRLAVPAAMAAALCASAPAGAEARDPLPESTRQLARAHNAFGFRLLAELLAIDAGKNICISPLSIAIALQMSANGAGGETASEMAAALQLGTLARDDFNRANEHLYATLTGNDKTTLRIANAIFARRDVAFDKGFLKRSRDSYAARAEALDFADPKSVAVINKWCADRTNGKIVKIIERIDPLDVAFLINAVYFKADWKSQFKKSDTREDDFTLASGSSVRAPLMRQRMNLVGLQGEDFVAGKLVYKDDRTSMIVFVPKAPGGLASFCARLTPAQWADWTAQFSSRENAQVVLPRFTLEYESVLDAVLESLGMKKAFGDQADFGPMLADGKRGFFISEVRHKTYVSVDEEGTEAAAVTSVGMRRKGIALKPYALIADRPFFYAICDDTTGAILFMGIVNDPRAS